MALSFPFQAVTIYRGPATGPVIVNEDTPLPVYQPGGTAGTGVDLEPRIRQAINEILADHSDAVSVELKAKSLRKFGRSGATNTAGNKVTIGTFQGSVVAETFVTTNIVDSIVSSSGSDTQNFHVEGHTIDGSGNLTFVTQTGTLNGQTEVTLATPLARCTRIRINPSGSFGTTPAAAAGVIAVYDNTGGITSGVPNTAAATKCTIAIGKTQSEKCATALSQSDYWIITGARFGVSRATGATVKADFEIERRDVPNGGAWIPFGLEANLRSDSLPSNVVDFNPALIVPANHDVRMVMISDTNNTVGRGAISGYLASIQ